jgi:hypothetical protein
VKPGQAASSLPLFTCTRLGPLGTIAKAVKERKGKPQKGWKNARFFVLQANEGLKQGSQGTSALSWVWCALRYPQNFQEKRSKAMRELPNWHELEQRMSAGVNLGWHR